VREVIQVIDGRRGSGDGEPRVDEEDAMEDYLARRRDMEPAEKSIVDAIRGHRESHVDERRHYLGSLRERVLTFVTYDEVDRQSALDQVRGALGRPEAREVLISARLGFDSARDYVNLAREHEMDFTFVDSPEFTGDVAVAVVTHGSRGRA